MALSHKITTGQGVSADTAYTKIENFIGNKDNTQIQVKIYYNKEARDNSLDPLVTNTYVFKTPDKNAVIGGYEFLKTLPEFKDAKDI